MRNDPILVIGSTGKTGSRIVKALRAQGHQVREGSRAAEIPFDWEKPESWPAALAGVRAAYISYFPDLAFPGAAEKIETLTRLAADKGLQRLVLLSGRGEPQAQACEELVRQSGIDYTLIRAAWFAQNFSEGYLREAVLQGGIAVPAGEVREPFVDVDDIAEVAVAALTGEGHSGRLYEVTGPRLISFAEAAAEISKASGLTVRYQPIGLQAFRAAMAEIAGETVADVIADIVRQTLDGRNARLADGVQRALGRPPRDFAAFCRDAALVGHWKRAA